MRNDLAHTVGTAAAQATPSATVLAALTYGITLNDVVLLASLFFIVAQLCYLAWKWRCEWVRTRKRKRVGR